MSNISAESSPGNQLEVSFTFKPKNGSKAGHHSNKAGSHIEPGNVPRASRLMALAIRFDDLVRRSEVKGYADLARLGYVTRARITQIMNLLNLAPDIQEAILFLPRTTHGRDQIREKDLRPIAVVPHWSRQRKMWKKLSSAMEI
ncbi:MAG: hypothetical protein OEV64_15350 [Desulfobulbaceae bacterium]|nr:hypothetical protein [Desulfobulbaceae bacterium]